MSAKTSARRREAFFRALAQSGNQTLAAERVKVSRSWVSLHRATDPAFRARMEACVAEARARISAADAVLPHRAWRYHDGEELVVRGSRGRRVQLSRARERQWTARVEARFLDHLAASCNVRAACRASGLSIKSAYDHRARWPEFARRWQAAVEIGYDRIEGALVNNAILMLEGDPPDPTAPMPPMSVAQAFQLIHMHQNGVFGLGRRPGRMIALDPPDVARGKILKAVAIVTRARARTEARDGADRSKGEGR